MKSRSLLVGLIVLQACVSTSEPVETRPTSVARPDVKLPELASAVPGLRLEMRGRVTQGVVRDVERISRVSVAVPIAIEKARVAYNGSIRALRIVSADPLAFRNIAPANTQSADFVWTSLLDGRAVLTGEASRLLRFEGGEIEVRKLGIPVGAFADNGLPNVGDLLIADHVRNAAGLGPAAQIIVGTRAGADLQAIRRAAVDRLGERIKSVHVMQRSEGSASGDAPDPAGTADGGLIGSMNFRILKNGYIEPDSAWVATNIASGEVPILGSVTCHRILLPQLGAALAEIQEQGLAHKIDRADFGGCYVPRFIGRDPRRGLSMHAFGLAVDLNVSTNQLGTRGKIDPGVIEIFEKWGFTWGGQWSSPDPMHFELARLIEV